MGAWEPPRKGTPAIWRSDMQTPEIMRRRVAEESVNWGLANAQVRVAHDFGVPVESVIAACNE